MTNQEMAQSYLLTAEYSLKQARMAWSDEMWHLAIRRCQEGVEMALKAVLRLVGIEVPKVHDVGLFLRKHKQVFPAWFQAEVDRLAHISRGLRKDREVSFYGDEQLALPPEAVFSKMDADEALEEAGSVVSTGRRLFEEFTQAGADEQQPMEER